MCLDRRREGEPGEVGALGSGYHTISPYQYLHTRHYWHRVGPAQSGTFQVSRSFIGGISERQAMPSVGSFGYLELCLFGIRELVSEPIRAQYLDGARPMRVDQSGGGRERVSLAHRRPGRQREDKCWPPPTFWPSSTAARPTNVSWKPFNQSPPHQHEAEKPPPPPH